MIQDKINEIKPYFKSLESYNDALIVRVQFPQKWRVFPSDDGLIKPAPSDKMPNEFFYYGDSGKVSLEDIFDFIKSTAIVNQSLEEKIRLLKIKIEELKKLFETTPLEALKTLTFAMETKAAKPKRKYTKRKKKAETKVAADVADAKKSEMKDSMAGETENSELSKSTLDKLKLAKKRKVTEN